LIAIFRQVAVEKEVSPEHRLVPAIHPGATHPRAKHPALTGSAVVLIHAHGRSLDAACKAKQREPSYFRPVHRFHAASAQGRFTIHAIRYRRRKRATDGVVTQGVRPRRRTFAFAGPTDYDAAGTRALPRELT
jgi:hypothetical protein